MAKRQLPDRKPATHKAWEVKSHIQFLAPNPDHDPKNPESPAHIIKRVDEVPREPARAAGALGRRMMKKAMVDGVEKLIPVQPSEQPVMVGLDELSAEDAAEFQTQGAIVPHYA